MESLVIFLVGMAVGIFVMGISALVIAFRAENAKIDPDQ